MISLWLFDCLASYFSLEFLQISVCSKGNNTKISWCCCRPWRHLWPILQVATSPEWSSENAQLTKAFQWPYSHPGLHPLHNWLPTTLRKVINLPTVVYMSFLAVFLACLSSLISHHPTSPLFHSGHADFPSLLWTQNALSFLNVLPPLLVVHTGDPIQKAGFPRPHPKPFNTFFYTLYILSDKRHLNIETYQECPIG